MNEIKQIPVSEAQARLHEEKAVFVDIRDPNSYAQGHIPGAIPINQSNLESFLQSADKNKTTIIYCYHGISSQSAAGFFQERGFTDVFSLIGGYEAWPS